MGPISRIALSARGVLACCLATSELASQRCLPTRFRLAGRQHHSGRPLGVRALLKMLAAMGRHAPKRQFRRRRTTPAGVLRSGVDWFTDISGRNARILDNQPALLSLMRPAQPPGDQVSDHPRLIEARLHNRLAAAPDDATEGCATSPVGLHPVPGRPRDQRRGHDIAPHPDRAQQPVQLVAGWPGLMAARRTARPESCRSAAARRENGRPPILCCWLRPRWASGPLRALTTYGLNRFVAWLSSHGHGQWSCVPSDPTAVAPSTTSGPQSVQTASPVDPRGQTA
jgi:hypothetical protein